MKYFRGNRIQTIWVNPKCDADVTHTVFPVEERMDNPLSFFDGRYIEVPGQGFQFKLKIKAVMNRLYKQARGQNASEN